MSVPTQTHPDAPESPTLSVKQAAGYLGIGRQQTYAAIARGEIPHIKIGRRILISRKRLDDFINGGASS